jgi:hypothetical protein
MKDDKVCPHSECPNDCCVENRFYCDRCDFSCSETDERYMIEGTCPNCGHDSSEDDDGIDNE